MVDSTVAWGPGDPGIKPVEDAGRGQYWWYWRVRGRRSGADQPDSSGTRDRGISHLAGQCEIRERRVDDRLERLAPRVGLADDHQSHPGRHQLRGLHARV